MKKTLSPISLLAAAIFVMLALSACGGGGDSDGGGGNHKPVANAGPDQNVSTDSLVTLDGSGSSDADNDTLTYNWTVTSYPDGSAITTADLSDATAVNPTFTPDIVGPYVLSLTVNDGTVDSSADNVTITAVITPPLFKTKPVPDSGQTASYTATPGEDSDYTFNAPSYYDPGNGTITDNVTHLVWQKQDDNVQRQWDAASAYCANLSLSGTGWRLPTPYELVTIADYGKFDPSIDTAVFPGAKGTFYWSTESPLTGADAWVGDFYDGGTVVAGKIASGYVRCVRGGNLVSSFTDNGDGTVTDAVTNLTWQQNDDGVQKTWEEALSYCEGLELPTGVTDWRLPNVKELASIENYTTYPVNNATYFPNTQESWYWTSTTVAESTTMAWKISFLGGDVNGDVNSNSLKTNSYYVRCVRGH